MSRFSMVLVGFYDVFFLQTLIFSSKNKSKSGGGEPGHGLFGAYFACFKSKNTMYQVLHGPCREPTVP